MTQWDKLLGDNVSPATTYSRDEVEEALPGIEGAHVVLELDDELIGLYHRLANVEAELTNRESDLRARLVSRQAEQVVQHVQRNVEGIRDFYATMAQLRLFDTEEEAVELLRLVSLWEQLNATFWHDVRTMAKQWNAWLEVRRGFRIVSIGKKYEASNG